MHNHELAGQPAPPEILENIPRLMSAYFARHPDPSVPQERVSFGTSGHRGSSLRNSFNEDHILAVTQAICDFRSSRSISGPLFLGMDTHALSDAAHVSALEVLAANEVQTFVAQEPAYTPTPVVSHAILTWNRDRNRPEADGIVITPSHNPPEDGGFKYNPPHGGPADTSVTHWIEERANAILEKRLEEVRRIPYESALKAASTHFYDYLTPYVRDLRNVVDMESIRSAGLRIGVDPMGGAGVDYWGPIAESYALDITVVNPEVDPTFRFMTLDRDGRIRMDCSSPFAMAGLIGLKDRFDIAFGNDTDFDRHGIVTASSGLLNPNHYLSVCVWYLFGNRSGWSRQAAVGKTLVSSSLIDRIAEDQEREVVEVPVGFKWFVDGLLSGRLGFGGEESAGASFLRLDGTVWTTDKDGFILDLLAAEILAGTGKDPGVHFETLAERFGRPSYERIDAPATKEQKKALERLSPEWIEQEELAGEPIREKLTHAPGNGQSIGGLKVTTCNGWFAARPSGTEDVYKIYAESFLGQDHLKRIQQEAKAIVDSVFAHTGA